MSSYVAQFMKVLLYSYYVYQELFRLFEHLFIARISHPKSLLKWLYCFRTLYNDKDNFVPTFEAVSQPVAQQRPPQTPLRKGAVREGGGEFFFPNSLFLYRKTVNISPNLGIGRRAQKGKKSGGLFYFLIF